jgi:hypothetical protein
MNCRKVLHSTNQYTSAKKLRDFMQSTQSHEAHAPPLIEKLKLAAVRERQHNEAEFKQRSGQMGVFGNIHQLLISVSDKFLQAEKHIANEDDTALQCAQVDHEDRSKLPWFRIMPGFATRNEGDRIRLGDTVILESSNMPNIYLQCADEIANIDERSEVNISSDATRCATAIFLTMCLFLSLPLPC